MDITRIFLDQLDSTNTFAMELLSKSKPNEGTVISTYKQGQGKGQIGRAWFSDESKNLSFSIILYPNFLSIKDQFYLNMVTSLAVLEVLDDMLMHDVQIKWPNDVIVDNQKIAGILVQLNILKGNVNAAICGVGLNVNQETFPSDIPKPISIFQLLKKEIDLLKLETTLVESILKWYQLLYERKFIWIKNHYLQKLYRRGELTEFVNLKSNKTFSFQGEIVGIDEWGKLVIQVNGFLESFALHELKTIY